jgi:hypothetical protein
MTPIAFDGSNAVMGAGQSEYRLLPAHRATDHEGTVTTCWGLSWRQRFRVLFLGRIWMQQLTFQEPLQPILLRTTRPLLGVSQAMRH